MKLLVFYETDTGRVRRWTTLQEEIADAEIAPAGQTKMELIEPPLDIAGAYVDLSTETLVAKQNMPAPNVVTAPGEVTISNLPDPCRITIRGQTEEVAGGSAFVEFDEPGTYVVFITRAVAFYDAQVEVVIP